MEYSRKFKVPELSSDPAVPFNGQMWYNTTTGKFMGRENGVTVELSATGGGGGGGSSAWGGITGTLSAQADLAAALAGLQPLSSVLTGTTASFTSAQQTKLAGVANGATANASDAALLDRANHTGVQAAATITGLAAVATSGAFSDLTARPSSPYIKPSTGEFVATHQFGNSGAPGIVASAVNSLDLFPWVPPFDFTGAGLSLRFNAGAAGGLAKFIVYEGAADFRPGTKIFEGADQSVTTATIISDTFAWSWLASKTYWLGIRQNIVGLSPNAWTLSATPDLYAMGFSTSIRNSLRRTLTYATAAPATWNWLTSDASVNASPAIMITV